MPKHCSQPHRNSAIHYLLLWLGVIASTPAFGQSADKDFQDFMRESQRAVQQQKQEFHQFNNKELAAFYALLKTEWRQFTLAQGLVTDSVPKPKKLPVIRTPAPTPPVTVPLPIKTRPTPPIVKPIERSPQNISFFGHTIQWKVPRPFQQWANQRLAQVNNHGIAEYWGALQQLPMRTIHRRAQQIANQLQLNDWGYMQFIHRIARQLTADNNRALLTTWGLLMAQKKDVRLGYAAQNIYMLFASKQPLYGVPFFTLDDRRYYLFSPTKRSVSPTRVRSYPKGIGALRPMNFSLAQTPQLSANTQWKDFSFSFAQQQYHWNIPVAVPLIKYFATHPQLKVDGYFTNQPSARVQRAIIQQLRPVIEKIPPTHAINFLLRLVQKSFTYQTDAQQFKEERHLLSEETLYYPASDCEDRAVFFAWLVKTLLDLPVIGIDYPGHIATAVAHGGRGKYYTYQGTRYYVADPTYSGANLGIEMPQFKQVRPRLFQIHSAQ